MRQIEKLARTLWDVHAHQLDDFYSPNAEIVRWEDLAPTEESENNGNVTQQFFLEMAASVLQNLRTMST